MGAAASQPADGPDFVEESGATTIDDALSVPAESAAQSSLDEGVLPGSGNSLGSIVPTAFTWSFGGSSVYITGAWDNWSTKIALARSGHEHSAILSLPVGTYQYKFIVDGNWRHSPALPTATDQHGNVNNMISIAPRSPEYDSNEPLSAVSGPPSPIESYDFSMPAQEDYTVEPTNLPPLFKVAPLNPRMYESGVLNPTSYVCLNHLFSAAPDHPADPIRTIATITRYKKNTYVTTVMVVNATAVPFAKHVSQPSPTPRPVPDQPLYSLGAPSASSAVTANLPEVLLTGSDNHV